MAVVRTKTKPRAPAADEGNRRAELIRAAGKLFVEKGFDATTIRDINHLSRRFAPLRMAGERMKRPLEQVNEEYTARLHQRVGGTSTHNLTLAAGRIRLTISGFLAAGVGTHDAEMLRDLHTKPVGYLAINRRHWATIVSHINAGRLTVRTTAAGSCLASVRGCKIE